MVEECKLGILRREPMMVGIAFLTLLEHKVLRYIHIHRGPNKVGFINILQSIKLIN